MGQPFFPHRPFAATRPRPAQSTCRADRRPSWPWHYLLRPCLRRRQRRPSVRPISSKGAGIAKRGMSMPPCHPSIAAGAREWRREGGHVFVVVLLSFVRSFVLRTAVIFLLHLSFRSLSTPHSTLTFRTRGGGRRRRRGGEALTAVGPAAAAAQRQGVSWHFVRRIPFHTNPGDTLLRGPGGRRRDGECSYSFRGIGRRDRGWRGRCGRGKRTTD